MTHTPLSPPLDARPRARRSPSWRAAMELLWHRREVEAFGTLVRVRIPVIGAEPDRDLDHRLTASLTALWSGRALSPDAEVHSVVAEFQGSPAGYELVLLVSADCAPRDHSIVGTRMIRDLRQTLRLVRRPSELDGLRAQAA